METVQETILGFSSTVGEDISLQAIKSKREIIVLSYGTSGPNFFKLVEPFHDSNKIYSSIVGYPSGQVIETDLEDLGVNDVFTNKNNFTDSSYEGGFPALIGGGWISKENVPTENTRIAFAVSAGEKWKVVTLKLGTFTENGEWKWDKLFSKFKEVGLLNSDNKGELVVPIVQTLRVSTPKGVIFVG